VDWITAAFLIGGILLIASELVNLALVPVFLGAAALIVAGLRGAGLIESVPMSLLAWAVTSVALTLPLRPLARRFMKPGASHHDLSHEDKDAMGVIVDVVEPINDTTPTGRVRFQGTTWAAQCVEGVLPAGAKAKLVFKDKLVWMVEPLSVLDDVNQVPVLESQTEQNVPSEVKKK